MEVDLPFQRRNVVEWSHRDQLTGALERARRETNHWSASTASAVHNYGKVVDHRAVNLADGRIQQTQRKQLEVFSTVVPGGSLQVFRSSTTSSSRSTITQMGTGWPSVPDVDAAFGDLQLALHPLDLSSEKTKASVGRSIGWRRPPTRVARVASAQQKDAETTDTKSNEDDRQPIISFPSDDDSTEKSTSIISSSSQRNSSRHSIIESRKSCSSENLVKVGADNEEGAAEESSAGLWGRSSLLRRSLQYTRPPDFPTGTSVKKMREEIEARGVPIIASQDTQLTPIQNHTKELPLDKVKRIVSGSIATQNHSFVTVKSLNEVRGRLRSKRATEDVSSEAKQILNGEDSADVIVTEDHVLKRVKDTAAPSTPRVQSYVFGMEGRVTSSTEQEKPSKPVMQNGFKSEEWFRRRKSYGFELDLPQSEEIILPKESKEDSLSDSGSTFRSSVFLPVSPLMKHLDGLKRAKEIGSEKERPSLYESTKSENRSEVKEDKVEIFEPSSPRVDADIQQKATVVNLVNKDSVRTVDMDRRRDMLRRKTEREIMKQGNTTRRLTDPVSVSIPIVSNDSFTICSDDKSDKFVEPTLLINGCHLSDEERLSSVDVHEKKRHSIAVVESGHIDEDDVKLNQMERLSQSDHIVPESPSDPTEDPNQSRKKRVEFSKTEVHFAAESGRFNLVSTDDKPPPTNIVRGRRRQKLLAEQRINRSGLPEMRFGDPPLEQKILIRNAATSEGANEPSITSGAIINVTIEGRLSPVVQHANERPQPQVSLKPLDNEGDGEKPRGVVRCSLNSEQGTANQSSVPMWRSTVTLRNNSFASPPVILNQEKSSGEAEFQRLLKSLRPTGKRNANPEVVAEVNVTTSEPQVIRSKGFSTKINVGPPRPEEMGENHGTSIALVAPSPFSHDLPEHKSTLNSFKLSRLGLESTPLVRLANRQRWPMPSEDEELSDDSLQADAEVRAYMVEKSSLINLGGGSRGSIVSPILEDHRYKHHASKAERLVQTDSGEQRACSPSSVYIVPEKNGFTKIPNFRSSTAVHLPLSSTLVDRVAKKVDAATQASAEPFNYEGTTSVKNLLSKLSVENKNRGNNDPPRERIIEIISASSDDGSLKPSSSMTWNKSQDHGLSNGPSRGAHGSGLFAESKFSKDNSQNEYRETGAKLSSPTISVPNYDRTSRFAHATENSELQADRDSFNNKVHAHLSEEVKHNKLNRRSPSAPRVDFTSTRGSDTLNGKDLKVSSASGRHLIDVVERFLRNERSHHDERRRRSDRRDPSRDRRRGEHSWERRENLEARRERDRHDRELVIKRELTPTNGGENSRQKTDLHFDAFDRREGGEDVRRNSYDRRDHREERHRSRSRGEYRDRSRDHRSRSRDDRMGVRGELDLKHRTHERRSRSRDELDIKDPSRVAEFEDHPRKRSRSRDELKHESRDSRSRSRSKDKLERENGEVRSKSRSRDEFGSPDILSGSRSRDELKHASRPLQSRRRSRDEQEPLHLSRERRSRSRDELDVRDFSREGRRSRSRDELDRRDISREGRRSRSRDELDRRDFSREGRRSRSRDELQRTDSPVKPQDETAVDVTISVAEGKRKSHHENEERRHRELERNSSTVKSFDQKRQLVGQGGRDRLSEPMDRRSRCKCSERVDSRNSGLRTDTRNRLGDRGNNAQVPDKSNRIHPVSRSNRNNIQDSTQSSRRAKASNNDKADKVVRKTRVHVAAMESPIAHMVKSTKERRPTDTKKTGDVQIIIEPLRPVRRVGVPKPNFPETNVKGSKAPLQKRTSGNSSDVNSNLSQEKSAASPLPQQIPGTDLTQKRPARRNNRKNPSES